MQFRGTDAAGNASAWTPASAAAANTVKIDRTVPTDPAPVNGGSLSWATAASVSVTASGATDSPGSGIASYQYHTSVDGGTTWGAPGTGSTVAISAQGETIVQFRAVDAAGFRRRGSPPPRRRAAPSASIARPPPRRP